MKKEETISDSDLEKRLERIEERADQQKKIAEKVLRELESRKSKRNNN